MPDYFSKLVRNPDEKNEKKNKEISSLPLIYSGNFKYSLHTKPFVSVTNISSVQISTVLSQGKLESIALSVFAVLLRKCYCPVKWF